MADSKDPKSGIDLEAIKREHVFSGDLWKMDPFAPLMHRHRGQLIAEVERDAARYQFLRDIGLSFEGNFDLMGVEADTAIDDAMAICPRKQPEAGS